MRLAIARLFRNDQTYFPRLAIYRDSTEFVFALLSAIATAHLNPPTLMTNINGLLWCFLFFQKDVTLLQSALKNFSPALL